MPRSLALLVPLALLAGALDVNAAGPSFDPERTQRLVQSDAGGTNASGDEFGAALAGGDLDGDGYDDLVVGAPSDGGVGTLFVFPGSANGFATGIHRFESDAERAGVPSPEVVGDFFGAALVLGNFDADLELELVAGAPGRAGGAGAVFVFQGVAAQGILGSGIWFDSSQLSCGAATAGEGFGSALAAGDFNGDGYDDLAIGAPGASSDAGKICIVPGNFVGLSDGTGAAYFQNTPDDTPSFVEAGDRFGQALAVGHFTDDAFADLVIGAPGEAPGADPAGGSVAVWFGKDTTALGDSFGSGMAFLESDAPGLVVEAGDSFGRALATVAIAGSADRLFIGAPGDPGGLGAGLAASFHFSSGMGPLPGFTLSQTYLCCEGPSEVSEDGDGYGAELEAVDLDGDGYDELVAGVPNEDAAAGMVMLYSGESLAGFALARSYRIVDLFLDNGVSHAGSYFGEALASGDFDGDGLGEVAIGAPVDDVGAVAAGSVYVVPEPIGSALGSAAAFALALLGGRQRR
jgi:hypothetical protein